jgi:cytochrome c-type biogenesis protein CcmF
MADLGYLALILALAVAVYSLVVALFGLKSGDRRLEESAKGGILAVAILVSVASLALINLLVKSDFSVLYVYQYTSRSLPLFYKLSAFWAGNSGSLLLWALVLTIYAAIVAYSQRHRHDKSLPYVNIILLINSVFFLFVLTFLANTFERTPVPVSDGYGLNPMLQNPGMVIHPITIFLGYVGFAVPFAFAMAALITKQTGDEWIKVTRRWSVIAWMFLSLGNLYGAQWAYVELGWGGFWAWDPVENASFIPWLTATAFIHSVMIQERKDMLKVWNMALIIITYLLTLFGTWLVRSGVMTSVHAFGTSDIGNFFLGFMALMTFASIGLLLFRMDSLKDGREFEGYLSRESSFLLNNLLLVGGAFAVFWGTIFPLVSQLVRGVTVTVGPPFFNQVAGPILLAMMLLMAICPLIAWRRASLAKTFRSCMWPLIISIPAGVLIYLTSGDSRLWPPLAFTVLIFVGLTHLKEFIVGVRIRHQLTKESWLTALWRLVSKNRRRYGGYLVHLGVVLISLAIVGTMGYQSDITKTVHIGDTIEIEGYTLTYQGLREKPEGTNVVVYADMPVTKNGNLIGRVTPEKIFHAEWDQPSTEVSILGSFKEDLYVILSTWDKGGEEATFKVNVNPLMAWMWIGGHLLVLGTIFAVWPGRGSMLGPRLNQRA